MQEASFVYIYVINEVHYMTRWVERIQLNSACVSKTSTDPPGLARGFSSDDLVVSHFGRKYTSTARNHYSS